VNCLAPKQCFAWGLLLYEESGGFDLSKPPLEYINLALANKSTCNAMIFIILLGGLLLSLQKCLLNLC
jgi:hypothetical protein